MRRRVVIVGMPRSGTTLLASLLHAQKGVQFLTEYLPVFATLRERHAGSWRAPLDEPTRRHALATVRDQMLRVRHACLVKTSDFRTLDELHACVMDELAGSAPVVGHKWVLEPRALRRVLDESRVHAVLMLRDPRDAAMSYWYINGGGVEHYLETWVGMAKLARELRDHPRLTTIRFEDLTSQPEQALAGLQKTLATPLDLERAPAAFHGRVGKTTEWRGNSAYGDAGGKVDGAVVGRWHEQTREPIVRYAGWRCARELGAWGYAPGPVLGPQQRLRALTAHARWAAAQWIERRGDRAVESLRGQELRPSNALPR